MFCGSKWDKIEEKISPSGDIRKYGIKIASSVNRQKEFAFFIHKITK